MTSKKEPKRTSSLKDWEGYYASRDEQVLYTPLDTTNFKNYPHKLIMDLIGKYIVGEKFLEVGAGDSEILIEVCKKFQPDTCVGLDYLESACSKLKKKSQLASVEITPVCADMFYPTEELKEKFDFVMSHGVVEHFHDLPSVISAIEKFARKGGIIFTLIPNNKNTIYGTLMRKWNIDVYNAHVMYDAEDLKKAHEAAGLKILWNGHLASSNFGMLSWCFTNKTNALNYWIYKQLTRISKLIWLFESKFGAIKATRYFSPYIVCIARVER